MGFRRLPHIFAFLTFTVVLSHAALSPQLYWTSVLPKTPMPKSLSELLQYDFSEEKNTSSVVVGKGGVHVNGDSAQLYVYYWKAATEAQLHKDPQVAIFFLEKDIHPGTQMNLHFTSTLNKATFLPRKTAESIPFSSNQLPEILNQFSVKPESAEADTIKETIKGCEKPGISGEEKYCATSLESMVDFITSKLGKNIQAVSTDVEKGNAMQKYTILHGVKKQVGKKSAVCHKMNYAYAVFNCHTTKNARAYIVPLEGANGVKGKAVAVCHTDTSEWNPKHLAFQVLKVKPGTVPICHFLLSDSIVWVPNQSLT